MLLLARLTQFSDSTLPIGSFAFSQGLESAVQTEIVHDSDSLRQYVELLLRQSAHMDGIALLHAHRAAAVEDYSAVRVADSALWDRRIGEEQQLMLARMGKKFAELSLKIGNFPMLEQWLDDIKSGATPGCFPVGQAMALAHMGAREAEAFAVQHYGVSSMVLSAALRLMRIDHLDTQRILFATQERVKDHYLDVRDLALDEMSSFAPVFDVLVAHHTKTHLRLFMN
ncbi:MAG: urease accessory protein UreF [Mesorhizobium sp.]|nr:urease accessory protein UreF [Mesorhizobium sp.]